MKPREILIALLLAPSFAAAATANPAPPDACTCVMTIVGGGDHKENHCDGFNPATHARCPCEKVEISGQPGCEPKSQTASPARAAGKSRALPGD